MLERGFVTSNLKSLLEHLLSEDVDEAAAAVAQARSEQLALAIIKGDYLVLTLYRPLKLLEIMNEFSKKNIKGGNFYDYGNPRDIIVGQVTLVYSKEISEVAKSAAEQGYGPLLYDMALSVVYPGFLISDRGSVSKSARKVWKYYFNNRTDVNKKYVESTSYAFSVPAEGMSKTLLAIRSVEKEMDNLKFLLARSKSAKTSAAITSNLAAEQAKFKVLLVKYNKQVSKNPLAYKYQIKKPKSFVSLVNNHLKLVAALDMRYKITKKQFEAELKDMAQEYFNSKYND